MIIKPSFGDLTFADYLSHPRNRGCVGNWLGAEGAGLLTRDISGRHNDAISTTMDPSTGWTRGKFGRAWDFDGSTDDTQVLTPTPALRNFDQISMVAWSRPATPTATGGGRIISKSDGVASDDYALYVAFAAKFGGRITTTGTGLLDISSTTFAVDEWQLVIVTYDGASLRMFVNGTEDATPIAMTGSIVDSNAVLSFGRHADAPTNREYTGSAEGVRIYNRALTPSEIYSFWVNTYLEFESPFRSAWFFESKATLVTDSNNRRNAADVNTDWASDGGGGAGPQNEPDLIYQGAGSVSRKIGTTLGGHAFTEPSGSVNVTISADRIAMLKGVWVNSAALEPAPSARHKIGSTSANWYGYQIADDGSRGDIDPPPTRLWVVSMINPNVPAWRDFIAGSPGLTAVTFYGIQGDFAGSAKSENVAMDAIDFNPGMWLCGGTDGTVATWLDFQTHDEGTIGNRFGHFVTVGNTFFLQGAFVIGRRATGEIENTRFIDSNRVLEFQGGRVDEGDNLIEIDISNTNAIVTMSAMVISGTGRSGIKRWFDSSADQVDDTNEEIDIVAHGFLTGDTVLYSIEGGTVITGLTDATEYFVRAVTVDSIALYAMANGRNDAYIDGTRVGLTAAGTGEQHSITRTPITHPDIIVTGNSGAALIDSCTLNGINLVTMTSGVTIDACVFNGVHLIDMATGAIFDGCTVNDQVTTEGVAIIETPNPEDITNSIFNASIEGGHAIDVEATGTFDLDNLTFTDFGPVATEFNASTDVDDGNDEIDITGHPWTDGDAIYYNDRGGTAITGLSDQTRYYVGSITANSISLYVTKADAIANTNKIAISTGSSEIHAIESADAAILNSSGGAVTLDVINGGNVPSVRNTAGSSTIVNNSVLVTVQGLTEGSAVTVHANETVGTVTIGDELASGFADNLGVFSYSQNFEAAFGAGLDVTVRARNQGIANAAILDDNGVFTDLTAEANSTTTNDLTLLPAVPVVNQDSIQFGHDEEFGQMRIFMTTAGTGGFGITWEFWNGSIWTALADVVDATSNFSLTGERIVSWTIPGTWATRTDNSQGPFFYVRARYTSGTVTVVPLARRVTLDVTRYLPFVQDNEITSTGLTVTASWVVDSIGQF